MPVVSKGGVHFKDAWLMEPHTNLATNLKMYDGSSLRIANTTAFFTGFAHFGIQDNTDWSANTFKTIYSHTGTGIVYGMTACTAGGAETTTFEITIDGVLKTLTVTNAIGERASLLIGGVAETGSDEFTAAPAYQLTLSALDSSTLTTFADGGNVQIMMPLRWMGMVGLPALRYDISCLIRMKHSVSITNSTATSFSGVLVRKGIAS